MCNFPSLIDTDTVLNTDQILLFEIGRDERPGMWGNLVRDKGVRDEGGGGIPVVPVPTQKTSFYMNFFSFFDFCRGS